MSAWRTVAMRCGRHPRVKSGWRPRREERGAPSSVAWCARGRLFAPAALRAVRQRRAHRLDPDDVAAVDLEDLTGLQVGGRSAERKAIHPGHVVDLDRSRSAAVL